MPSEVTYSPPLHRPGDVTARPRGILKNPSFSAQGGQPPPIHEGHTPTLPPSTPLDPEEAKEITIQNTLQNAGHRRSSSAARRASASRRHSSAGGLNQEEDAEKMRLKWDEANLYLAEQESGGRMKITEPKTPFQFGGNAMDEDEGEEDVSIDPRFVQVDEVDLAKRKASKKQRESDIPGLELGEPEDESAGTGLENDRIVRSESLSREGSKDKHVSVDESTGGVPPEIDEKHRQFEEQRKKHYEMRSVKDLLGHPENVDADEEDELSPGQTRLPSRGVNGDS